MELDKILKQQRRRLTVWVTFDDHFELELVYTDRQELTRMLDRCKKRVWQNHQQSEIFDDKRFNVELAGRINDWSGLTLGKLSQLTNIDLNGADPETQIPCTAENKIALLEEIYGLNAFVRDLIMDIQAFREKELAAETKNSLTSQGNDTA